MNTLVAHTIIVEGVYVVTPAGVITQETVTLVTNFF